MTNDFSGTNAAAAAVGVDPETLRRWVRDGKVTPTVRTAGGQFRWNIDDLREQLRSQPAVPPADKPSHHAIVAAVVTSDLGILITKRNDGKPPYGFVTGKIEPGESPWDAAVREVKEETGLEVRAGRTIGRRLHPSSGRDTTYVAAHPSYGTKVILGDPEELAEVRWTTLAEASRLMPDMYEPVHAYLATAQARPRKTA
jgi:8-oxo-dGTP diphosphatase